MNVSVWSSAIDHSLESVLVFQSPQISEEAEANIQVYDDVVAQQIARIDVAAPSGPSAVTTAADAPPSMDQEADTLIVHPLKNGAEILRSAPGSNIDFLLMTQLFRAVKPKAYRVACGVTGSNDLESLAFRNPDGTYVLLTVNHSRSAVRLETFWKNGVFTYTQAGSSIGFFAWDPKRPVVMLLPREAGISATGSISIEAKCSNISPLGIDLRCEGHGFSCSIYPVHYFNCGSQEESVPLTVKVDSKRNETDSVKPGFITITAAPEVGEPTILRVPCCGAD